MNVAFACSVESSEAMQLAVLFTLYGVSESAVRLLSDHGWEIAASMAGVRMPDAADRARCIEYLADGRTA